MFAKRSRGSPSLSPPPPADDRDDPILDDDDDDPWALSPRGDDDDVEDIDSDGDDGSGHKLPRRLRDTIVRLLGQGGFNCAYLTTRGDVLRLALYPAHGDEADYSHEVLHRGVAMLRALNTEARSLGPALLRTTGDVEEGGMDELPRSVIDQLCPKTRERIESWRQNGVSVPFGVRYLMDHVEFLAGGTVAKPADARARLTRGELDHCAFTLMWYLYVAGAEFGFRHGDLKSQNVAFRTHAQPQTHRFVLRGAGDHRVYVFSSAVDAVVIDLDLGRVATTRAGFQMGTYYAAPPEALAMQVVGDDATTLDRVAYDWWGIGIVILELHLMPRYERADTTDRGIWLEALVTGVCTAAARAAMDATANAKALFAGHSRGQRRTARVQLISMYTAAVLVAAVHQNHDLLMPPSADMPALRRFFTIAFPGAVRRDAAYLAFYEYVGTRVPRDVLELLRYLLNWNPGARHRQNRPYLHFGLPLFANYTPRAYEYTYAADARDLEATRDPARLDRLRRYPDVEAALLGQPAAELWRPTPMVCAHRACGAPMPDAPRTRRCTCCAAAYCSEPCHAAAHAHQRSKKT